MNVDNQIRTCIFVILILAVLVCCDGSGEDGSAGASVAFVVRFSPATTENLIKTGGVE